MGLTAICKSSSTDATGTRNRGNPQRTGRWRLEGPSAAFVGQIAVVFPSSRNFMVRTGKQRVMPQQFTMKTFIPRLDFKGRNRFVGLRMQGRPIGDHRRVCVGLHRPRCSSRRHQDHPETGQQYRFVWYSYAHLINPVTFCKIFVFFQSLNLTGYI